LHRPSSEPNVRTAWECLVTAFSQPPQRHNVFLRIAQVAHSSTLLLSSLGILTELSRLRAPSGPSSSPALSYSTVPSNSRTWASAVRQFYPPTSYSLILHLQLRHGEMTHATLTLRHSPRKGPIISSIPSPVIQLPRGQE
jgi:hypothetical protein